MYKRITSILAACAVSLWSLSAQTVAVSLEECLRMAQENDAAVRNSRLDLVAAREQLSEARWEFMPRVSVSSFAYWSLNPLLKITVKDVLGNSDAANEINNRIQSFAQENGVKTSYSTLKDGFGASATVLQPLYAGGRIVNGNRLAALGVEAAGLQSRIKEKGEAREIERKYWAVVALQEKMNTLLQAKALLDTLSRDAQAALAAGLMVDSDARAVRDRQNELKAAEVKLRGGLRLSKMDLFNAIGYKYTVLGLDEMVLSDELPELEAPSRYVREGGAGDESALLSMQVRAKELEKKMAVGESLPQLMVGANYSYGNVTGNSHMRSNVVGFVALQIPITDLGKATHKARRMETAIEKARNDRDYLDSQLELRRQMRQLEMETAWDSMMLAAEREDDARSDVSRAEANYRSGRSTLSDYLRAELDLRTATEALINAKIGYRNAVGEYLGE